MTLDAPRNGAAPKTSNAASTSVPGVWDDDAQMARWRDAAERGDLPAPTTQRWQPLRGGVVNLWEFDVAEYWFANGRAQFVGQNQSGKSTLMALTTLIMLAGDLDRQYVDTFGEQQKSFRYYVEPTDEPTDRRPTDMSTSRGWAWVEYGRVSDDGTPVFYSTLLYAQARRGANDFVKTWAVCEGDARVRDGLVLNEGAAVSAPADLKAVPGFKVADSGQEYKRWQGKTLFGFADAERMDVVVRMLKVLRTPHLGRKLDPDFLTDQMRDSLPAIDRDEIDELAEGWDQLDRLATDRDNARNALAALVTFARRSWGPWADMTLRLYADALAAATTRLDDVTREDRRASEALVTAQDAVTETKSELTQARFHRDDAQLRYDEHLRSAAFRDAQSANTRIEQLTATARLSGEAARRYAADHARAEKALVRRTGERDETQQREAQAQAAVSARAAETVTAAAGTRISDSVAEWISACDTTRVLAACHEQRIHLDQVRKLLDKAQRLDAEASITERSLETATRDLAARAAALTDAVAATEVAEQTISDLLERWAAALDAAAPPVSTRQGWIDAVHRSARSAAPAAVLDQLVRRDWLAPALAPVTEEATIAEETARMLRDQAKAADAAADAEQARTDPVPEAPTRWTRRHRPDPGVEGAPLWRVLDPADDLPGPALDRIEAALAAAGLLDAWVTPDGVLVADRDGNDVVVTPGAGPAGSAGDSDPAPLARRTLAAVLRVAKDAGPLAGTAAALLATIGWSPGASRDDEAELDTGYGLRADGRWTTPLTSGQAAVAPHGAELIGTAARAASRARRIEKLRADATTYRAQADERSAHARALRARAGALTSAADAAPSDKDVVAAALGRINAQREKDRAQSTHERAQAAHATASTARDNANAELLQRAGDFRLPHTAEALTQVAGHVETLTAAAHQLELAVRKAEHFEHQLAAAARLLDEAGEQVRTAAEALAAADDKAGEDARRVEAAREELSGNHADVIAREAELRTAREQLAQDAEELNANLVKLSADVTRAEQVLEQSTAKREAAEAERDVAVAHWWVAVDSGLAAQRGVDVPAARTIRAALDMARTARDKLRPPRWGPELDSAAKEHAVADAWTALVGRSLPELRLLLEASGGRTVTPHTREETGTLEAITVRVDSTGDAVNPQTALRRLEEQVAELSSRHDEKMNAILSELLSSTFIEHLRDRLAAVIGLLKRVNDVLLTHPTGATRTTLRLLRVQAPGQEDGFLVLEALAGNVLADPGVQAQVRSFLERQIREAQELGRASARDWKDHLADLLDYRTWFAVRTEYRVSAGDNTRWHALTKEVHAKDSGGGKVVTLLQPLLATLVALYNESPTSPRPVWLDEAFTGVDDENRSTMLDLIVNFDLDFLMAGPGVLAATAEVPSAAIWFVSRAPAPDPGVDLSLTLWAGRTRWVLDVPDRLSAPVRRRRASQADDGLGLFGMEMLEDGLVGGGGTTNGRHVGEADAS